MYKERVLHPLKVIRDSTLEPPTKDSDLVRQWDSNAVQNAEKKEFPNYWRTLTPKKHMHCAACGKFSECVQARQERWACERCWLSERNKLFNEPFWREWEVRKTPMRCTGCEKSSECAKIPGPGLGHSNLWICKRCWTTEMRERRNYNTRRGLFRGNPDRLVTHPWPKRRRIRIISDRVVPSV